MDPNVEEEKLEKDIAEEQNAEHDKEHAIVNPSRDYVKELLEIVRSSISPVMLREKIDDYHSHDVAMALSSMSEAERKKLYRILDIEDLADIFTYVKEDAAKYLNELDIKRTTRIFSLVDADEAVDLLRQMDRTHRSMIIDLMDDEDRRDVAMIASFDEDEIGSRLTTNYITLRQGLTVKEAMKELIHQAEENDNVSTLYMVDANHVFYGAIDLKDLITARQNADLDSLVTTSYPYLYGGELISDCIERLKRYSEDSIPVLDNNNKLLGVITSQDVVEIVGEEMEEDYVKLAGLSTDEDMDEPVPVSVKKRMPWLLILLFLGMGVSSVVGVFEGVVAQLTIVMLFQSLILDMAGNVGTQSLGVTIRVLMDEHVTTKEKLGFLFKETRVGLVNGLILGILSCIFIGAYIAFFKHYPMGQAYSISLCIGAALMLAMTISSFSGTIIPMIFKKVGVDPAVASGPLITTVNDLVAVVTYYGLAWIFLIGILHMG